MKFIKLLFILLGMSVWNLQATDINGGRDPFEKRYIKESKIIPNQKIQKNFRQSEAWKSFQQKNRNWYVSFDERNGMPHRASGKPIPTVGSNPVEAAQSFLSNELSGFEVPLQDLKFQTENFSGKYYNVFYTQQYHGLDILNSKVFIKMTPEMKVSTFGLDIFRINGLSLVPAISSGMLEAYATKDLSLRIEKISPATIKILPLPVVGSYEFRLVYEFTISTFDEHNVPGTYYSLIDANTGELLYRQNRVRFNQAMTSDIGVVGTVSISSPFQPTVVVPLRNLKVEDGSTIQYTDSLGETSISGAGTVTGTFTLAGLWSRIFTDGGSVSPITSAVFNPGQSLISFDSVTTLSHVSGYYHVNIVHDFMKSYFPAFTNLDFALPTQIDLTGGSCNAFYDGSSINFYESNGGCYSMAQIGDIVYHEYGHGINDKFYQWQGGSWDNGGMGEGYADVWGLSITQNPILGPGYRTSSSTSYIRRYDTNKKVYPQDLTGEVHDDGEIIAGAWYDVSLNFGSWVNMTALFADTYYDLVTGPDGNEGQIYTDILLSALNHDDNDGDLSNGTPNAQAILDAFALHGISLLNSVEITHAEVISSARLAPITIDASMAAQYPFYNIDVVLNYKTSGGGAWTQIPMTNTGAGTFTASIPGQASGTLISYYLEAIDGGGTTISTNPEEAVGTDINIPYFILVDFEQQIIEDFDVNQSAGWLTSIPADNASSGFWVIDAPVSSYTTDGVLCQTGQQHTVGGIQCAVTGNAADTSLGVGNSDVDGGKTTLQTPLFDITGYDIPLVSYWRWFTNDQGSSPKNDFWRTYISEDGVTFVAIENLKIPDHRWRRYALKVHDYFPGATSVMLRFVADDANGGSIIEAAIDDIEILDVAVNVSVEEIAGTISVNLYPNPARSEVSLDFQSDIVAQGEVEVINSIGQVIFQESGIWTKGSNHLVIDTRNFTDGVYRILLRSEKRSATLPLAIIQD